MTFLTIRVGSRVFDKLDADYEQAMAGGQTFWVLPGLPVQAGEVPMKWNVYSERERRGQGRSRWRRV
jgi:hypothetical protein